MATPQRIEPAPGFELQIACFKGDGSPVKIDSDEVVSVIKGHELTVWVHVFARDLEASRHFLQDQLGFHELSVEDALSPYERPSTQEFEDVLFVVAPAVHRQNGCEEYSEVSFFLQKTSLVTVSTEPVPFLNTWYERWTNGKSRSQRKAPFLMHALIDAIVDEYFPVIDALEDEVDELADAVYGGDTKQVKHLLQVKRRFLNVRRNLGPLRDVLNSLLRHDNDLLEGDIRPYLQDAFDHTLRLNEILEMNRETLTSVLDVHLSTVSNNLNEIVKKMTVISTILMTGALVAGIYGMNFKHMPELDWIYGYPFALGLMLVLSGGILLLFKRKNWL